VPSCLPSPVGLASPPLLASVRAPVLGVDGGGARFSGSAARFGVVDGAGVAAPGRRRRPPWLRAYGWDERGGRATVGMRKETFKSFQHTVVLGV
jgi:hypothetical protein